MAKSKTNRGRKPTKGNPPARAKRVRDPNKPTQAHRWEAERGARRRRSILVRSGAIAVAVALVGGIVAWQVTSRRDAQRTIAAFTAGACNYDTRSDPGAVNQHAPNPTFRVDPPSGGVHPPTAAAAGVYRAEDAPPEGQVVHALEHGLVAIHYRPDLSPDRLRALEEIANDYSEDVLLLPRAELTLPVAAVAWHRRLLCDEFKPANIRRFVTAYKGNGPEKVPNS